MPCIHVPHRPAHVVVAPDEGRTGVHSARIFQDGAIHLDPELKQRIRLIGFFRFKELCSQRAELLLQASGYFASLLEISGHVEQTEQHPLWRNRNEVVEIAAAALTVVNRTERARTNFGDSRLERILPGHQRDPPLYCSAHGNTSNLASSKG